MQKYLMIEKQNLNSEREPITIEAKNLKGAKIAASKQQAFFGTILEIQALTGVTLTVKEKSGKWVNQDYFDSL